MNREVTLLARDLCRLLADMTSMHDEMAMHMRNKLEAIRKADSDRIQSITAREMTLAGRVAEREGLRRQITRKMLAGLGLDPERVKEISLNELAEYFQEPQRSQLLVSAAGLRDKLNEIKRIHVSTALVTQEMLKHLDAVMQVMRSGVQSGEIYSRSGRHEQAGPASVFEAVG